MRKQFCIAAILCLTACATNSVATNPAPRTLLGPFPGSFLALSVADIDRQLAFYRDTLGFQVQNQGDALNGTVRFAILHQGFTMLELIQHRDARSRVVPAKDSHLIHGIFKAGFLIADIDYAYETLTSRRVRFEYGLGKPDQSTYRSFGVRDPEGNLLQFFGR